MTQMLFGPDFDAMLRELSAAGAEFLIVGAYAFSAHVHARATKDLDIWIRPTPANAARVWNALLRFGAPLADLTVDDLAEPGTIYQMSYPPYRIDLLTSIQAVTFEEAWENRAMANFGTGRYPILGKRELMTNKAAVGRAQDLLDLKMLRRTK